MGIDIGTSGCKAIIFDKNGKQLASSHREYNVLFSKDGAAELDSEEVIDKCFEVIYECTHLTKPGSVKGLGISSQGEAFVAIGPSKEALCPAMVSSDTRSEPYVNKFYKNIDKMSLYQITGHTGQPLFSLFKLLWLAEKYPDIWSKSIKFLCFEDLLQLRLGLEPSISWPMAGRMMLFDVRKHEWNKDILDAIGLRAEQLARPLPSGEISGIIDNQIIRDLGLAEDAFVVTGGHDQPVGALGAGVTRPGMAMYATGSVECITAATAEPIFSDDLYKSNLCTYDHTVEGMYVTLAYSLTGGNILKWFKDEFGKQDLIEADQQGVNVYTKILENIEDQPTGLFVLPYFTPSGTPYFDTKTKGAIFGLRLSTTRGEFVRALLEGVAFEMRFNLDILEKSGYKISELRVVGGGAASQKWTQLKADILGKKMITVKVTEAGCLGVAMLACSAHLGIPVKELTNNWIRTVHEVFPQDENKQVYDKKYDTYRELYANVRNLNI
jgi:xylulokinase